MADAPAEHRTNYMAISWWLAALTVLEIAVIKTPLTRLVIGVLLVSLATSKAAMVALYFMHLRFETRTLGYVALTPLAIATLLVFLLLPDARFVEHRTADSAKIEAPAEH